MFVLEKFCFFLSLSTGTLIIGILNLMYGLLHAIVEVEIALSSYRMRLDDEKQKYAHTVSVVFSDNSIPSMQLIFGAYLIYGTIRAKPTFLFATVFVQLAIMAYSSCFLVFAILVLVVKEEKVANPGQIINELCKIPVLMYFVSVIHSHYEKMTTQSPPFVDQLNRRRDTADGDEITLAY
ncbi:Hypothetical protein NTJ_13634 [Nesidiocoris tenuis]|uniref:SSD domain-containing protein n=1 Tax=Nesidiocoris tenuis TaxID=355587 RepID=A0ABN7BAY4_9HEMI|nr:Hypothetical protein NTJ_13634 [Nesidiocoris tenuis]